MQTFIFQAKEGKMTWGSVYNHQRFLNCLKENEGKDFRIELLKSTRSLSQNSLYWLYLEVIERETGNSANDLHEYFRRVLLSPKMLKVMGKEIKVPKSTTELEKQEFSDYMDKICAEVNIPIPDTNEYLRNIDLAPLKDNQE